MAGAFETWVTKLRLAWMGDKAKAIMGGFAAALGDRSADEADAAVKFRFPLATGDPETLPLIGSSRLLPQGPSETDDDYAVRLAKWIDQWKLAGTPAGILVALHFAGFDDVVLLQQNGVGYTLTLPLPAFVVGSAWDPTPNVVRHDLSALPTALTHHTKSATIAAGTPWWMIDGDTLYASRFTVLFPGPLPGMFITVGTATFSNTDRATVTWDSPFDNGTYLTLPGPPVITSGGPVIVSVDGASKVGARCDVVASAPFSGTVDVLAWEAGTHPYANLHAADRNRLIDALKLWKPAKAKVDRIIAVVDGKVLGWPLRSLGNGDALGADTALIGGGF